MTQIVPASDTKGPSPRRKSVHAWGLLGLAAFTAILPAASAADGATAGGQDISGVWWATTYSPSISLVGGGALPYNAAGKAAYDRNIAGLKDGTLIDTARRFCTPDGVPRFLEAPYPFEIVQTPGQVTIIHELNHSVRPIEMDRPLPKYEDVVAYPYYSGHSVGHWDGNTLVIETTGFNEKTFLDATGAPHSDAMTTVERVRKIDGGKNLEDIVMVHDPDMFTRDWSARFVYASRNDVQLQDYVCGEKHRDISSVRGVQGH
jgi:hypothetical protein